MYSYIYIYIYIGLQQVRMCVYREEVKLRTYTSMYICVDKYLYEGERERLMVYKSMMLSRHVKMTVEGGAK